MAFALPYCVLAPSLLASALLVGCTGAKSVDDTAADDSAADDSSTDSDSAIDDTAVVPPDFSFVLSGDWDGTALTLNWLDFTGMGGGDLSFGRVAYSAAVEQDTVGVPFGVPPEDELQEVDATNAPGMKIAAYVPALHVDSDRDGTYTAGETYVGVGLAWPVYVSGPVPSELAAFGIVEGWNGMEFTSDGSPPILHDLAALPIATNLAEHTSITVGGSYAASTGSDSERVALIPGALPEAPGSAIYDEVLSNPWTITLDGAPPADHFSELDGIGNAALEMPLAYTDVDASAGLSEGDTPIAYACWETIPVGLLYVPGVTDLVKAVSWTQYGLGAGWMAVPFDGSAMQLTGDELLSLEFDTSCGT
jgi:hypothetical protein